jgi:hypothetical protein
MCDIEIEMPGYTSFYFVVIPIVSPTYIFLQIKNTNCPKNLIKSTFGNFPEIFGVSENFQTDFVRFFY